MEFLQPASLAQAIAAKAEPPTISSAPAVVAAIRAATGRDLTRIPVRPEHITGT